MNDADKLELLEAIASIAKDIAFDATAPHNSPPPHRVYIVEGSLIRKLGTLVEKLHSSEEVTSITSKSNQ
jgi:hypothetical protein